jgi:hypothetical protein
MSRRQIDWLAEAFAVIQASVRCEIANAIDKMDGLLRVHNHAGLLGIVGSGSEVQFDWL